ncbi:amidophosphoribosyltransferase [Treponema phagedenis]|uniref:Amidophosphoribosyltransferase n=1 Tax=Treponema phagedenis TaxID=162 RepID=A0A0B7GYQ4_TREPH|nr:amidophosphoribosyltransferase [Treponema phagedenis]EFW38594.1 amidophosphoribosyltransferase [Treponema phagedenis F0421]NVP24285.1 amidophosphoribosyltransferase [Treponema phagedenis]QEJ94255.1 amidophosphoribosyltransferase [Treponema phagedenis]QEJ99119.1 amidophosphoribosyltransferase [Treponema phagedenis]QEK00213.1 amidophosphoribosyltransferase [Treponema phagedenis]
MSGIFGIYSAGDSGDGDTHIAKSIYYALYALQHRGQKEAGIATLGKQGLWRHKGKGLVSEIFTQESIDRLVGSKGVGHVKYSFANEKKLPQVQPFTYNYPGKESALAVDGAFLHNDFVPQDLLLKLDGDESELLDYLQKLKGSYAIIHMTQKKVIAVRDPWGIKPLFVGEKNGITAFSSESCAMDSLGIKDRRMLAPGEVFIQKGNTQTAHFLPSGKENFCAFEKIYIARPDSIFGDTSIYNARFQMGAMLYDECKTEADIVIGAPDSGLTAALGYAQRSGIQYREGIMKNRYVGRTFIAQTQEERDRAVFIKLNPIQANLKNKRIILVDDSIVRGTTIKRTLDILRSAGALEIHVRIASPPVIKTCRIGIDIPDEADLISSTHSVEEVRKTISADSLYFLSLDGLRKACGGEHHCTACFDGQYPIR